MSAIVLDPTASGKVTYIELLYVIMFLLLNCPMLLPFCVDGMFIWYTDGPPI